MDFQIRQLRDNAAMFPTISGEGEELQAAVMGLLRDVEGQVFLVEWNGPENIEGLVIGDKEIAFLSQGAVFSPEGLILGGYERLKRAEGPKKQNQVLINLWSEVF